MHCASRDIFLSNIIGYDKLELYLKIHTPRNEILGTTLLTKIGHVVCFGAAGQNSWSRPP